MDEANVSPIAPDEQISPIADGAPVVPPLPIIEQQAIRHDYALGERSPGRDRITAQLASGQEEQFRQTEASNEEAQLSAEREQLITSIARHSPNGLNKDDLAIIQHIATSQIRVNPDTILEKQYGRRVVDDLIFSGAASTKVHDRQLPANQEVEDNIASTLAEREWHRNFNHKLDAELEATGGLGNKPISTIYDHLEHLVTGFPSWWRLRNALSQRDGVEFLAGNTIEENVKYLWSLPPAQRRTEFSAAVDYLKSRSPIDARLLAQAMIAFPSSEQFLNNLVTAGDYTMIGSAALKAASRLTKTGDVLLTLKPGDPGFVGPLEHFGPFRSQMAPPHGEAKVYSPLRNPWIDGVKGSDEFTTTVGARQPDLFGEQSAQGRFRFMDLLEPRTAPRRADDPRVSDSMTVRDPASNERFNYTRLGEKKYIAGKPTAANVRDSLHPNDISIPHTTAESEVQPVTQFRGQGGKMGKERLGGTTENLRQTELEFPPKEHQLTLDLNPVSGDPSKPLRIELAAAIKATVDPVPSIPHVLAATGNIELAGKVSVAAETQGAAKASDLADKLPTFAAPHEWYHDAKYIARDHITKLTAAAKDAAEKLLGAKANAPRVARLTPQQLVVGQAEAKAILNDTYNQRPHFSDHNINIHYIPAEAHADNVDTMVYRLGMPDGTGFKDANQAKMYQRDVFKLGEKEAYIGEEGKSFFVDIPRHIDETTPQMRAIMTPENTAPVSMMNAALRWLKTTDDLIAPFQRKNAKTAQFSLQGVRGHVKDLEDAVLLGLSGKEKKELFSLLEMQRDLPQTKNPSMRGVWSNTAGEFEQTFIEKYGRPPTEAQTYAYDTYRRVNDFDWMLRNSALYRDMARQGVEGWRLRTADGWTEWFNGIVHQKFPWHIGAKDGNEMTIYTHDAKTGEGKFFYRSKMTPEEKKAIDDMVASGQFRTVQIHDPKKHPLEGFAKTAAGEDLHEQVNYVVSNGWDKGALNPIQLKYNPGSHVIYPHKWYVAIPLVGEGRLGKLTYFGDNVALNVSSEAEAKMWAGRIDTARQMARLGDPGLAQYVSTHLPMTMEEFAKGWLKNGAQFSLDHPVIYKEAGHSTLQTNPYYRTLHRNEGIVDSTRNPHDPSSQMDNAFVQDRDLILNSPDATGKRLVPAEQLDPYAALNKALNQSLRNVYMNDHKLSAMEQFYQQFGNLMEPKMETLLAYPSYFLHSPQWANVASNQWAELGAGKATQKALVNFMGTKSEIGGAVKAFETQVQSLVFKLFGSSAAGKMDTSIALGAIKDPFEFMRAYAFHATQGLFTPASLLTQMAQMTHAIAVTGVQNGLAGVSAAVGMRMLQHNPSHIDAVARMMTKFGWTEAEFKDMWRIANNSGIGRVGGEAVIRSELDPPLIRTVLGHIVFDLGPVFFNEGERLSRFTSMAAAYRQLVRGELKGKTFGARELATLTDRADLLNSNMTRASAAAWQQGLAATPLQFFAWQARMVEQMTGGLLHDVSGGKLGTAGRLTGAEKARAITTYSILFGVPAGLSPVLFGLPLSDTLQKEAMKRQIDLSPAWAEAATQGLAEYLLHLATGKQVNLQQKLGPGNNQALADIIMGDKSVPEVLFGASGTALGGMIKAAAPFYYHFASAISGTGEYKILPSDFMQLAQTLKVADSGVKAYMAISYQQWVTRNGAKVTGADNFDALLAVLGLTPLEATNTFLRMKAGKELVHTYEKFESQSFEDLRAASQAVASGDFDRATVYFKRASAALEMGQVPWDRRNRLYHRATTENGDLRSSSNWKLYNSAKTSRHQQALEYYQNSQKAQ